MSPRLRRTERLLELAGDAVDAARARAATAARGVEAARAQAQREERSWLMSAQELATGVMRATDLEEQSAHLRTLRLRADHAARDLDGALAEERRRAAALVEASMERRKLEIWRDRTVQAEREERSLQERRSDDELAARTTRTRP